MLSIRCCLGMMVLLNSLLTPLLHTLNLQTPAQVKKLLPSIMSAMLPRRQAVSCTFSVRLMQRPVGSPYYTLCMNPYSTPYCSHMELWAGESDPCLHGRKLNITNCDCCAKADLQL